ncbi:MAG: hypothetical protein SVE93_03635 [Candidatus Thermoplasmatota archaeon]|nr:hypothetical protein [Candidatus Thermoplasmatota archaeon]
MKKLVIALALLLCGCIGAPPAMEEPQNETAQPEIQQPVQPAVEPYDLLMVPFRSLTNNVAVLVEDLNNYFGYVDYALRHNNTVYNQNLDISALQRDYNDVISRDLEKINASLDALERSLSLVYGIPMELINAITTAIQQTREDLQQTSKDLNIDLNRFVEKYPMVTRAVSVMQRDVESIDSAINQIKNIRPS